MVTITVPEKAHSSIASSCVPGASRVVLYKFGKFDIWFVLLCKQYRGTYKKGHADRTQRYSATHNMLFLRDVFHGVERGCTIIFRQKKQKEK